ncbi:hypothetical protein [Pseudomonas sp. GV047]|uniref:hypothetical protein n=1 Tax=Pseudomonas sp. GV047 TaxID=2135751 RepID=UPI000D3CE02E|nr:hypothetical protein [Pseudomonas sp. GV047]
MSRITKHIEALQTMGLHSAIYELRESGDGDKPSSQVDLRRLGRHFNMMLKRRHSDVTNYHFFWFRTGETITVCYTGSMFLLGAVEEFMTKAVEVGIAGEAVELFYGRNRDQFNGVLQQRLSLFSPQPLQRSYGGAHLG